MCLAFKTLFRNFKTSVINQDVSTSRVMNAWRVHNYGDIEELQYSDRVRIPVVQNSEDVLIRVLAAGVNPIDTGMLGGYGAKLFNLMRCNSEGIEFPLTLGREFSGIIMYKGMKTSNKLSIGDHVWGVVPLQRNGSHADFVLVPEYCISKQPQNLNTIEAGALLYAGLTAWSGIFITGQLGGVSAALCTKTGENYGKNRNVLVLGASGGVGSIAVQILKAEGATVFATCSLDAIPLVESFGATHVFDYKNSESLNELIGYGPFDIILDCAGKGPSYASQLKCKFSNYVTFSSPLLKNIDEHGIPMGALKNCADIIQQNVQSFTTRQALIKWAYFYPSHQGIEYLKALVELKKIRPVIDSVFEFKETAKAYSRVIEGHLRGKVALNLACN